MSWKFEEGCVTGALKFSSCDPCRGTPECHTAPVSSCWKLTVALEGDIPGALCSVDYFK